MLDSIRHNPPRRHPEDPMARDQEGEIPPPAFLARNARARQSNPFVEYFQD